MARRVAIIQGHPDAAGGHLCHAFADTYRGGAVHAGHQVREILFGMVENTSASLT